MDYTYIGKVTGAGMQKVDAPIKDKAQKGKTLVTKGKDLRDRK